MSDSFIVKPKLQGNCSGRTLVSACRCWMFVSDAQPVAILNAVF